MTSDVVGRRAGLALPATLSAVLLSACLVSSCYVDRETSPRPRRDASIGLDASLPRAFRGNATPPPAGRNGFGEGGGGSADMAGGAGGSSGVAPPEDDAGVDASQRLGPRIAFFGDQSLSADAEDVLRLVVAQEADAIVHLGDFDYWNDPAAWLAMIDAIVGPELPYLAVVGNHDVPAWEGPEGYQARLEARLPRMRGVRCEGDVGWRARCEVMGVSIVLSGVGSYGDGHEAYLEQTLAADPAPFRICAWHKNQQDLQVGAKGDEVGWAAYQICQAQGAFIVTGHEHSYARTYTLSDLGNAATGHGRQGPPDVVRLSAGTTAVVVSGLGGHSTRDYLAPLHDDDTWWASIYARGFQRENGRAAGSHTNIGFGALFIDFGIDGDPHHARAYFATVNGVIADRFDIISERP